MKGFHAFADHWFGSWVINGLSVVAFILVLKILVARAPSSGPMGAVKAGVGAI